MLILGIDPGSRITGFGLVEKSGNRCMHVENGSLYCRDVNPFPERLAFLFEELKTIITRYKVQSMAVENIFYHKNPQSIQRLSEVRGAILLTGALSHLPIHEYTALQVKQAVTGYGKASKGQVQVMIRKLLNLSDIPEENASDALGIALCHAHQAPRVLSVQKNDSAKTRALKDLLKKSSFYR